MPYGILHSVGPATGSWKIQRVAKVDDLCYSFLSHVPPEILTAPTSFDETEKWSLIKRKADEARAARAVFFLREHGIESILLKGVACARYYPPAVIRDALDTDLAVSAADYARAVELVSTRTLAIDLHCELRQLDTVAWEDLLRWSRIVEMAGQEIRVLAPEDHLRVLATHWLIDGGRYRHRLWDIYYIVNGERASLEWDRVLSVVPGHRRRWIECVAGCAEKYLDLYLTNTPLRDAHERLPGWFVAALEREWQLPDLRAVIHSTGSTAELWLQIKRRLSPNPITATVMMNGSLDAPTRVFYQLGNVFQRLPASVKRGLRTSG